VNDTWLDDDDTVPTSGAHLLSEVRRVGALDRSWAWRWAASTDTGRVRPDNEDAWLVTAGGAFVVADGMGGRDGGRLAADTAVQAFADALTAVPSADLRAVVRRINGLVRQAGDGAGTPGSGTTLVALTLRSDGTAFIVNVGDSRAYHLRAGRLSLSSRDHNVRNAVNDAGVDPSQAGVNTRQLEGLTSYLGSPLEQLQVQVVPLQLQEGDRVLLCTDGIHRQLDETTIGALTALDDIESVAAELVARSAAAGGRDNATAVIVEVVQGGRRHG
jgi:PPM family protein phosphatase